MIVEGGPFEGEFLAKMKEFLSDHGLRYAPGIEYSVCMTDSDGRIIAAGSVEENVIKCVAVDSSCQGLGISNQILTALISYEFQRGRSHLFLYTRPENEELFFRLGFYPVLKTEEILLMENWKDGFRRFADGLERETPEEAKKKDLLIGAVVANCNPFTKGHRYLLEKAVKKCDYLHLFLLDDPRTYFSPEERYQMAAENCRDLEQVIIHKGSEYVVSAATFPTYFLKDKSKAAKANCRLDLELFARLIAPKLQIQVRFVGTEPVCEVTHSYNCMMKELLPSYGIRVEELERLKIHGVPVSASDVRAFISCGRAAEARELVLDGTWPYVERKMEKA